MNKQQWIRNKILDRAQLAQKCNRWRHEGHTVVFTNGCFDILHHGHLRLITSAADLGDKLIVALNTDNSVKQLKGESRPVTHEQDRLYQLASLLLVDAVCLFDEATPAELIRVVKPDVLVKGGDYTIDKIIGADFVLGYGGEVKTIPFVDGYSTSSIIGHIKKM